MEFRGKHLPLLSSSTVCSFASKLACPVPEIQMSKSKVDPETSDAKTSPTRACSGDFPTHILWKVWRCSVSGAVERDAFLFTVLGWKSLARLVEVESSQPMVAFDWRGTGTSSWWSLGHLSLFHLVLFQGWMISELGCVHPQQQHHHSSSSSSSSPSVCVASLPATSTHRSSQWLWPIHHQTNCWEQGGS